MHTDVDTKALIERPRKTRLTELQVHVAVKG
jgi:hypothetical protein